MYGLGGPKYGPWSLLDQQQPNVLNIATGTAQALGNLSDTYARNALMRQQLDAQQQMQPGLLQAQGYNNSILGNSAALSNQTLPGLIASTNATNGATAQTAIPAAQAALLQSQLGNQYTPQDKAIALSNAITKAQQQAAVQSRFGSPAYTYSKTVGGFPTPVRNALIQSDPAQYSQMAQQAVNAVLQAGTQGQNAPSPSTQNPALNALAPYAPGLINNSQQQQQPAMPAGAPNQGLINNSQSQQPVVPSAAPNQGLINPRMPLAPTTPATPASAPGGTVQAPPAVDPNASTTTAIQNAAANGLLKGTMPGDQVKRVEAGNRFNIAMQQIDQAIPSLTKYSGLSGKIQQGVDSFQSSLGNTNSDYQNYINMQNILPVAKGDLSVMLGARATDMASKDINQAMDFNTWQQNPKAAQASWDNLKKLINQTEVANKQPLTTQFSTQPETPQAPQAPATDANLMAEVQAEMSRRAAAKGGK